MIDVIVIGTFGQVFLYFIYLFRCPYIFYLLTLNIYLLIYTNFVAHCYCINFLIFYLKIFFVFCVSTFEIIVIFVLCFQSMCSSLVFCQNSFSLICQKSTSFYLSRIFSFHSQLFDCFYSKGSEIFRASRNSHIFQVCFFPYRFLSLQTCSICYSLGCFTSVLLYCLLLRSFSRATQASILVCLLSIVCF